MTARFLSLLQFALLQTHIALFRCGSSMDTLNVRWKFFEFCKKMGCVIHPEGGLIKKDTDSSVFPFSFIGTWQHSVDIKEHKLELENSRRFIKAAYRKGSIIKRTERFFFFLSAYAQQIRKRAKTHLPFIRRGFSTIKATDRAAPNQIGQMLYVVWSTWFSKRCFESLVYYL